MKLQDSTDNEPFQKCAVKRRQVGVGAEHGVKEDCFVF